MNASVSRPQLIPTTYEINLKPWKYIGWPGFTRFAASDNDFLVLRRFDVASTRVLLAMQDKISQLEEVLNTMDAQSCVPDAPDLNNGSFREEYNEDRNKIIGELKISLLEYSKRIERLAHTLLTITALTIGQNSSSGYTRNLRQGQQLINKASRM